MTEGSSRPYDSVRTGDVKKRLFFSTDLSFRPLRTGMTITLQALIQEGHLYWVDELVLVSLDGKVSRSHARTSCVPLRPT